MQNIIEDCYFPSILMLHSQYNHELLIKIVDTLLIRRCGSESFPRQSSFVHGDESEFHREGSKIMTTGMRYGLNLNGWYFTCGLNIQRVKNVWSNFSLKNKYDLVKNVRSKNYTTILSLFFQLKILSSQKTERSPFFILHPI